MFMFSLPYMNNSFLNKVLWEQSYFHSDVKHQTVNWLNCNDYGIDRVICSPKLTVLAKGSIQFMMMFFKGFWVQHSASEKCTFWYQLQIFYIPQIHKWTIDCAMSINLKDADWISKTIFATCMNIYEMINLLYLKKKIYFHKGSIVEIIFHDCLHSKLSLSDFY